MKKMVVCMGVAVFGLFTPFTKVSAQDPITLVIQQGITKVIRAVDLKIQRLQNKTIWLQNAQKVVENAMSKLKLDEITDWVEKQRTLYKDYFDELWQVKGIISDYYRIKEIVEMQVRLVSEYKRAWTLFRQDNHFTPEEIGYMARVYKGILDESLKNLDQLLFVINSYATQMTDAKRLQIINGAAEKMEESYNDLKAFNQQGILLSLQRSKSSHDVDVVKQLYGIQ